jgi:hypothetical protein
MPSPNTDAASLYPTATVLIVQLEVGACIIRWRNVKDANARKYITGAGGAFARGERG